MKLIKSIIRQNKMDDVKDALAKLNISGMTVTEVRGHGKQKGHTAIYRGKEYDVSLLPKMEIEVVVEDSAANDAIKAIVEAATVSVAHLPSGTRTVRDSRFMAAHAGHQKRPAASREVS